MSTIDEVTEIKKLYACPEPCNGWCGIYSEKLDIDPIFPFSTHEVLTNDMVNIIPCDIGIEIGFDYIYSTFYFVFKDTPDVGDVSRNFYVTMMRTAMEIYRKKDNPKTYREQDRNIIDLCLFLIPVQFLQIFKEYVANTPEEVRQQRRDEIAMFIENHLTDSVSDQEIFDFMNQLPSENKPTSHAKPRK